MVSAFVCLHLSTAAVLAVTKALNHALITSCSVVIVVLFFYFHLGAFKRNDWDAVCTKKSTCLFID